MNRQSSIIRQDDNQHSSVINVPNDNRQHFIVIGLDDSRQQFFQPEILQIIRNGRIFSGGLRHREIVGELLPPDAEWINITVPLEQVFAQYKSHSELIVFASGDPLFFGFANTIRKRLQEATLKLYPTFNSLQILAHRLLLPYDDMRIVSLTGRPWQELDRALIERASKIGILTDREHTPSAIARRMLDFGYTWYIMYTGEHLGNENKEQVRRLALEEASVSTFKHPNNVILHCNDGQIPLRPFGIPDDSFEHLNGRARMITKAPIRLLTLRELELNRCQSFWDIGFCTGSVSIEARLQFPHLSVTSFEIRPEGEELMLANSRRFGAPGIRIHTGDFLRAGLSAYPRPDAVFIGGHGGKLKEMIIRLREVMLPGGIVVFNSVSPESRTLFIESVQEAGLRLCPDISIALNDYNPIHILKAIKL